MAENISDISRRLTRLKIPPGSNPFDEMGEIEDLTLEIRISRLSFEDRMSHTIMFDARPAV